MTTNYECPACGLKFNRTAAFDMHRTGSYGEPITGSNGVTRYTKHQRRCLSEEEMRAIGMVKHEKGWWSTGKFDASAKQAFDKQDETEETEEVEVHAK